MGEIACGAHQTLKKRPWEIAILVYGFPSHLSALQFEWAWQKPHLSRYINRNFPGIYHKKTSEQFLPTKLRVLVHLLQCSGFSRWPLNLHFLISQVQDQFNKNLKSDPSSMIPNHIPITFGSLNLVFPPVAQKPSSPSDADPRHCYSCQKSGYQMVKCLNSACQGVFHLSCLASRFSLGTLFIIPIQGECPKCSHMLVWGNLIQSMSAKKVSLIAKADEN
ncbi:Slx4p interacting protein [Entomophthora muscae]|uniref:Slx4p interacting protein n=1 Tax=Entomophthora muscae TaxID=34485 RepID=A0ACC2STX0_9FUNG|nr:Slx4p interacting protein [Entomophthora muscae]